MTCATIRRRSEALAGGRRVLRARPASLRGAGFGKASFLRLKRDMSDELQRMFAKQRPVLGESFAALEDIDIADHLEARGQAMVTKTGELGRANHHGHCVC